MANSSIIGRAKNKIVRELINDSEFLAALDVNEKQSENIIGTHIFTYNQNPFTLEKAQTFITIQVSIPESYASRFSNTFVYPTIEIWIISHEKHMKVDNVLKINLNRNDYISELLDRKFNGRTDFGLGKIELLTNIEGSYQSD